LRELSRLAAELLPAIGHRRAADATAVEEEWLQDLERQVAEASTRAAQRIAVIEALALAAANLAGMEYDFLYDKSRHLLAIGYNVGERRRDSGYYDLLASEARFSAFVAIAQGKLPQESWFALGRLLTTVGGDATLVSWSGSMFEYLMPCLVMPAYEHTLLDETCRAAVKRQIAYGSLRGVPWGISESGYNAFDSGLNYQYRAFGVPGLGLKRGLADDLVIAPYASALALMVAPEAACLNLQRLAAAGLDGRYGFYEAIDYTPSRVPRGQSNAIVRSFMAHHQGMIFLSLAFASWAVRCRNGSSPSRHSGRPSCCSRNAFQRPPRPRCTLSSCRRLTRFPAVRPCRCASSPVRHAVSRSAAAVERQVPRDGHQRGRRRQPLERPRRHALARRHDLR
jgi:hypothetical protein